MPGPIVRAGDRVVLRTAEREDLEFLQRSYVDGDLRLPMGNGRVKDLDGVEERFEEADADWLLACDGSGGDPGSVAPEATERVGLVSVSDVPWARTEIGYWIVPERQGEGLGGAAVELLLEYTFRTIDTPSVGAVAYDHNDASRGLLESLGFSEEGRKRRARFVDGTYRDEVVYGLLREEWEERQA